MDDLSGADLRRALELVGIQQAGDFERSFRQEMTEGIVTAATGRFQFMLEPEQLRVEVPVHFKPDKGVTVPVAGWNQQVHNKWDQFAAVEPGGMRILGMIMSSGPTVIVRLGPTPDVVMTF